MARRKGTFLERTIANLFERIGFNVSLNSTKFGFEADVIAEKNGFVILIEAKQYDKSYMNIGSLLHQWESKGRKANADKTLVAIAGLSIPEKYFYLAKELGIHLWDEDKIHELNNIENNNELYGVIGESLEFKEIIERIKKIEQAEFGNKIEENLKQKAKISDNSEFNDLLKNEILRKNNIIERLQKIKESDLEQISKNVLKKQAKILDNSEFNDLLKNEILRKKIGDKKYKELRKKKLRIYSKFRKLDRISILIEIPIFILVIILSIVIFHGWWKILGFFLAILIFTVFSAILEQMIEKRPFNNDEQKLLEEVKDNVWVRGKDVGIIFWDFIMPFILSLPILFLLTLVAIYFNLYNLFFLNTFFKRYLLSLSIATIIQMYVFIKKDKKTEIQEKSMIR
ncbi:MAG: restriction endonuclease [Nanoarchaeota archaeon]|nr:restriction endonuclease [Nanoarchaeota archaeon]